MQTLIKWPGGKTSEYKIIKKFIPEYNRYIEPFFGGGAVFFNLPPQPAIINDISANLMQFYSLIKTQDSKFKKCLYSINEEWDLLKKLASNQAIEISHLFVKYRENESIKPELENKLIESCKTISQSICDCSKVVINKDLLQKEISRMVKDKVFRTRKNEIKNGIDLNDDDLKNNIITGFTSGYYMYLRDVLNRIETQNELFIAEEYKIAIFYFVREFCYGSMFRYNKAGEFNIPYGGMGYNNKDFEKKIDLLFTEETQTYFKQTEIFSCDFEEVLNNAQEGDFIFLDPPYDTDFSDYENRSFGEQEQRRLAKSLHDTKAKFLLIIKNTPLISELYQNNGYRVYAFDNKYSYCVKGRNDRNAVHLIVTNYD
ncbi:MAG: DNA adenine methylase [Clostridia bacterium]|nr:DNA adenine methylase [Clostridia bacterium]